MKIGIMQPYFLPYIGYWQLINYVDKFIVYDNIQYTKKGWINRNRYFKNGTAEYFTIPLKKDSDFLDIKQRTLALEIDKKKILNKILLNYRKAPFYLETEKILEKIFMEETYNLFDYLFNSMLIINEHLRIDTDIVISSNIDIDHSLRCQEKVIALNKALTGNIYINPIGGKDLYDAEKFTESDIQLRFIKSKEISYMQYNNQCIQGLSVLDVLMFNGAEKTRKYLNEFELING